LPREIAPHGERAQSLVEKDQSRRVPIRAGNFLNFELAALNGDERKTGFLGQTGLGFPDRNFSYEFTRRVRRRSAVALRHQETRLPLLQDCNVSRIGWVWMGK